MSCGRTHHDPVESFTASFPAERVTWRCCNCGGLVCRECCLTMPEDHPDKTPGTGREYYEETYCSERCRRVQEAVGEIIGAR